MGIEEQYKKSRPTFPEICGGELWHSIFLWNSRPHSDEAMKNALFLMIRTMKSWKIESRDFKRSYNLFLEFVIDHLLGYFTSEVQHPRKRASWNSRCVIFGSVPNFFDFSKTNSLMLRTRCQVSSAFYYNQHFCVFAPRWQPVNGKPIHLSTSLSESEVQSTSVGKCEFHRFFPESHSQLVGLIMVETTIKQ